MASDQENGQPTLQVEDDMDEGVVQHTRTRSCSPNMRTPHKSSVYVNPFAVKQTPRFEKGDSVHMSIIENGVRDKGIFTVRKAQYNASGDFYEYQLTDNGRLYKGGAWIRENSLKLDKKRE